MKSNRILGIWILWLLACAVPAWAENAVRFSDAAANPGDTVVVEVTIENDIAIAAAVIPFHWSSPDLALESVSFVSDRFRGDIATFADINADSLTGSILLRSNWPQQGWMDRGSGVIARLHFRIAVGAVSEWVTVDSLAETVEQGGRFTQFSDVSGSILVRAAVYAGTITVGNPAGQTTLSIVPDRLDFASLINGPSPPAQSVSIRSIGGPPVSWQASASAAWLAVTPALGHAPGEIQVGVAPAGLTVGTHTDTLTISSPAAVNSPVQLPITLTVEATASLAISPASLNFHRTLPGPHPPSQVFDLQFLPAVSLAWSMTTSSQWLKLLPTSGNGAGQINVGIDTLFSDLGEHHDTIVVTAVEAGNSPVKILVTLLIDTATVAPPRFSLSQNRPNPFSAIQSQTTSLTYTLAVTDNVAITFYDVLGHPVRHLLSGRADAGTHDIAWDGRDDLGRVVASGIYFCRMKTPAGSQTRHVVVIK